MADAKTMLVFGGTGNTGKYVLTHALDAKWRVVALVRSPDRIPEGIRSQVVAVTGDLNDEKAVAEAVRTHKPHAIMDASSTLPTNPRGRPQNSADRPKFIHALYEALEKDKRLGDCSLVILGGQVLPEPGGTTPNMVACAIYGLIWMFAPSMLKQMNDLLHWLWFETPEQFRFVYVRAGPLEPDKPSRGLLMPERTTEGGMVKGAVTCTDMAAALVALSDGEGIGKEWVRSAVYLNYIAVGAAE